MAMFSMTRQIGLANTEDFYTRPLEFNVQIEAVCGQYGPNMLNLAPEMQAALSSHTTVTANLADIAHAALQFFQVSGPGRPIDILDIEFILTREFGQVFQQGWHKRKKQYTLGMAPREITGRHSEAIKTTVELFGYGLVLVYMAKVLGTLTDLFDFITEATTDPVTGHRTAQADFTFNMTYLQPDQLANANPILRTINDDGKMIYIEVKSYTGWGSFREDGAQGKKLLENISSKAKAHSDGHFVGILVGLPNISKKPERTPTLFVADPNDPEPLETNSQLSFILKRYLSHCLRYGLWQTGEDIRSWLHDLGVLKPEEEAQIRGVIAPNSTGIQRVLPQREFDGEFFRGRYFIDLLARLGSPGNRGISREAVEQSIESGNVGQRYFAGINVQLVQAISSRSIPEVFAFSFRRRDGQQDTRSAFIVREVESVDGDTESALDALRSALRHW